MSIKNGNQYSIQYYFAGFTDIVNAKEGKYK